jgi:hypothetical protein
MVMNQKPFHGYPITLTLHEPPQPEETDLLPSSPRKGAHIKKPGEWTDAELVREAREIIIQELLDVFNRDLKSRIVVGKVWDHIRQRESDDAMRHAAYRQERSSATPAPLESYPPEASTSSAAETAQAGEAKGILKLPSFSKRKVPGRRQIDSYRPSYVPRRPSDAAAVAHGKGHERDDDSRSASSDRAASHEPTTTRTTAKVRKARVLEGSEDEAEPVSLRKEAMSSTEDEEELPKAPVAKTKKKKGSRKAREARLEAFLDEDAGDEEAVAAAAAAATLPTPAPTDSTLTSKREVSTTAESDREWDLASKPSLPSSWTDRPRSPTPDPWKSGIALDDEDLYYVRLALERLRHGDSLHPSPEARADQGGVHETGSARSEGYYKINQVDKAAYLLNRNQAIVDTAQQGTSTAVATSRLARVNTRRLVQGFEQHKKQIASDTDVLKFNQLRTRKKQLKFSRSSIHWYGLYSMEVRFRGLFRFVCVCFSCISLDDVV